MSSSTPVLAAPPTGYRLAWQDEFEGSSVDESRWDYRTGARLWSTQLPENVAVSGGLLRLLLKKETVGSTDYTAGGLISKELFRYGYYEARMKVPPGAGWHTSFWMMRNNLPADATVSIELDVIENDSINPLQYGVNTHRHRPTPHLTYGNKNIATPSLNADFHIFGCEFTPTTIRYYCDGTLVQTVDATPFAHNDLNIWLTSVAASLGGTTSVDESQLPSEALFDWVRYYEPFPAPTVAILDPTLGSVMLPDPSVGLRLEAHATAPSGAPALAWTCDDGPGTVTFTDPSSPVTSATFSTTGEYILRCSATNDGGTVSDTLHVGVASPVTIDLREGNNGYTHGATLIRGDHTDWNAGARDQVIVGRNSAPLRALFSFDLSPISAGATIHHVQLDLTTVGGTGTVGTLELRQLSAIPAEGNGISDGTTGSNLGTGTGATWITRNGGTGTPDLWNSPGGDFSGPVLTSLDGYDATTSGDLRTLPDAPGLVAAAQANHGANTPLSLVLTGSNESSSTGFTRLASDDDPSESRRPVLRINFSGNQLPTAYPGLAPGPLAAVPSPLAGAVTNAVSSLWRCTSGPATAAFADPNHPTTNATFPQPGIYQLELSASNALGTVRRDLTVTVSANPGTFSGWQQLLWPGISDSDIIGPTADPDHDGRPNLLEWALALDPTRPDAFPATLETGESGLTFSYIRRKVVQGEAFYQVEWCENLDDAWTTSGVSEDPPATLTGETESVLARLPAGSGDRRFVRLRVTTP